MRNPLPMFLAVAVVFGGYLDTKAASDTVPPSQSARPPSVDTKIHATVKPDLIVAAILVRKIGQGTSTEGEPYETIRLLATIKNQGGSAAGPFIVITERKFPGGTSFNICGGCSVSIGGLAPHGTKTIQLSPHAFKAYAGKPVQYRVTVDNNNTVVESNEANNTKILVYP